MRLISSIDQLEAIYHINIIKNAILDKIDRAHDKKLIEALESCAHLTVIVGGEKELKRFETGIGDFKD